MESTADEIPSDMEYEALTIELACRGDAEAGREALQICIAGLYTNRLSAAMRFYLAQRLADLSDGMKPGRAMNIEEERGRGRPATSFPGWETPLAAFGALLYRRGYIAARIEAAMDQVRQEVYCKGLDAREARRICKKYEPMRACNDADLIFLCGDDGLRGEIDKFPPASNAR